MRKITMSEKDTITIKGRARHASASVAGAKLVQLINN